MRTAVTEIKAGIANVGDKVDKGNEVCASRSEDLTLADYACPH